MLKIPSDLEDDEEDELDEEGARLDDEGDEFDRFNDGDDDRDRENEVFKLANARDEMELKKFKTNDKAPATPLEFANKEMLQRIEKIED